MSASLPAPVRRPRGVWLLLALALGLVAGAFHLRIAKHRFVNRSSPLALFTGEAPATFSPTGLAWAIDPEPAGYEPLAKLALLDVRESFGPGPRPQLATDALLHALTAACLLLVLRRTGFSLGLGLFVAAAFAFHPLAVETTAWVDMRGRLLAGLFTICGFGLFAGYLRGPRAGSAVLGAAATLVWLVALAAHPAAAFFPVGLWLVRKSLGAEGRFGRLELGWTLLALATWILSLVAVSAPLAPGPRVTYAAVAVLRGLGSAFLPLGLAYHVPHPALGPEGGAPLFAALGWVGLLLLAGLLWRLRARYPAFVLGLTGFLGATWVSVALPDGRALGGDRHAYLGLPFLLAGIAAGVARWSASLAPARARAAVLAPVLAVAVLCGLAAVANARLADWRNSGTLNRRALFVAEENAVAHANLALDLYWRGQLTLAEDHLKRALELRPDDSASRVLLARIAIRRSALLRALEELEEVLAREPDHADARLLLGETLQRLGDPESLARASQELERATALRPRAYEPYTRLGQVALARRDLERARVAFGRAVEIEPGAKPDAWCGLGIVCVTEGAYDEAILHLERALEIEPDYVEARTNLGRIWVEREEWERAEAELRRALEVHPRFHEALFYLAQTLEAQGASEEAIDFYERTVKAQSGHIRANVALAWLYAGAGRHADAEARTKRVLGINPNHPEANDLAARLALVARDWGEAELYTRRALESDPRNDLRARLGRILQAQDRPQEAETLFAQVLESDPEQADALYGRALLEAGRFDRAEEGLRRAVAARPDYPEALRELGRVQVRRRAFGAALESLERALALQSGSWELADQLAVLLAAAPDEDLRDGARAFDLASRAVLATERRDPAVLDTLAAALAELERWPEARQVQREALKLGGEGDQERRRRLELYREEEPLRLPRGENP